MSDKIWLVTIMVGDGKLEFHTDPMPRFMVGQYVSNILSHLYDMGVEGAVTIEDNKGRTKR